MEINSQEYWQYRFEHDWQTTHGTDQTVFFAHLALSMMPNWFKQIVKKEKLEIYDMGCAMGETVHIFSQELQVPVCGVDFSPEAIKIASKNYPKNNFYVMDLNELSTSFHSDVIFCSNVIEHFHQPWIVASNLARAVHKYLILMFPYEEHISIEEHVYRFDAENIPLRIEQLQLIFANSVDASLIANTLYADKQILLIYASPNERPPDKLSDILRGIEHRADKDLEPALAEISRLRQSKEELDQQLQATQRRVEEGWRRESDLAKTIQAMQKNLDEALYRIEEGWGREKNLQQQVAEAIKQHQQLAVKVDYFEKDNAWFRQALYDAIVNNQQIEHSLSWRLTKPMRSLGNLLFYNRFAKVLWAIFSRIRAGESLYSIIITILAASPLAPFCKKILPTSLQMKLYRAYQEPLLLRQALRVTQNPLETKLLQWESTLSEQEELILVYSGVKYVDSEGQRSIRLIHEILKKGAKVIFVYWRWDTSEPLEDPGMNILALPIDYLYEKKIDFFQNHFTTHPKKTILVEFPHPSACQIVELANCFQWMTLYDVIDDWEEFSQKGQAVWYDRKAEIRLTNLVDINIATAVRLREKLQPYIRTSSPFLLIGNGVDAGRLHFEEQLAEYNFCKGDLQIGYFGHLTAAWFDWDLVCSMAQLRPNWTFHLIGYGAPKGLHLPGNVLLYGKKGPEELAFYAAYWNVAIIPFINCELTLSVNPIKIYEYLQLHLPVVASNMPEVNGFPYTQIAIGSQRFIEAIERAATMKVDTETIQQFVQQNTWTKKCEALLDAIRSGIPENSYKQIYRGDYQL